MPDPWMPDWIEPFWRAIVAIAAVIALARFNGLRSFSKMSSFDFALTVAMGSILAGMIANVDAPVTTGLSALAAVFVVQGAIALLRTRSGRAERLVDNEPRLLMRGETILHDALREARITEDDLYAKLREANVLDLAEVRAVVLETTGDISVLHAPPERDVTGEAVLRGVRGGPPGR